MPGTYLTCHNNTACAAVETVEVECQPHRDALHLSYALTGELAQLRIPAPQPPSAAERLWQHTCFEAFIALEGESGYHEFNFSPSGQWAAYAFSDYRVRSAWTPSQHPVVSCSQSKRMLHLQARIDLADLPNNQPDTVFQLGMTAVIETSDGELSYWAAFHPKTSPDFHYRTGFTLSFNPANDQESI